VVFLSGDIHIGRIFDISPIRPPTKAVALTSSGISQIDDTQPLVGTFVDGEFSLRSPPLDVLRCGQSIQLRRRPECRQ
jgi:hypothetical protein